MNVEIRRQGIAIRTVPVAANRVRIGSGDDCEIQLKDRFVAQLVAELVRDGEGWRLLDTGTSLEGVVRGGTRVMDERVQPGEPYSVGAFEIVIEPERGSRAAPVPSTNADALPMTMMSADLGVIPGTMIKPADPTPRPQANRIEFTPVAPQRPRTSGAQVPPRGTAASRRRILLVVSVALATICVGLAIVVSTGSESRQSGTASSTATTQGTAQRAVAVAPVNGDELASNLEIDKAFAAWEAEFMTRPSTELRDKIVSGAFELARAHAAADDTVAASRYFVKVVRYGDPNSDVVRIARARIPQ